MASKRHGKVTRISPEICYTITIMTADGRRTEERTAYGKKSENALKALEGARLAQKKQLLLDLVVNEKGTYLFGMDEEEYFRSARKLERLE